MIQYNRRNSIWLAVILLMTALAFVAGQFVVPGAQAALIAMVTAAVMFSFIQFTRPPQILTAIQERGVLPSQRNSRLSSQAREAQNRAQSRGATTNPDLMMIDVGLIASSHGEDGMVMRRTRSVSKDDDGVRPFVTLDIKPVEADRKARLRFEIIDQNGDEQYIHEMDVYLRDGELNILADHHLPLAENTRVEGMGDWDLRVYLDNQLYGMHSFQLTPSYEERRDRLGKGDRARRYYIPHAEDEERGKVRERDTRERDTRERDTSERASRERTTPERAAPERDSSRGSSMTLEELLRDQDEESRSRK